MVESTKPDVLIISDYAKGTLDNRTTQRLIAAARSVGTFVAVDPKHLQLESLAGAQVITPTAAEWQRLVPDESSGKLTVSSIHQQLDQVKSAIPVENVIVTCGADGLVAANTVDTVTMPALTVSEPDAVGAGDAVVVAASLAFRAGGSFAEVLKLASCAGAVMASRVGTTAFTTRELQATCLSLRPGICLESIPLYQKVAWWKHQGLTVGFTNGCFDLIHAGHTFGLNELARRVDRVVVGVNSDASVRVLKGEPRPLCGEVMRVAVLASLTSVDAVTVFDAPSPVDIIEQLRPNVLAKGAEYSLDSIAGSAFVNSYGGHVMRVPMVSGLSTTRLLDNLR